MTFEITIPVYALDYGPIVLAIVAALGLAHGLRRYLQARKSRKIVQARLAGITGRT